MSATHDHTGEPLLWCETHQHTHIASMPRFTFLCKDCGWGQWYGDQAREHEFWTQENLREAHETYEVEHVMRPMQREITDARVEAAGSVLYASWESLDFDDETDDWARGTFELVRAALEAARAV